jgi:hypothetical protein
MASLNLTPVLFGIHKNADGSYIFICSMNDASGNNRGFRELKVATDGTVTDASGTATGTNLTPAQMTTLNSNWTAYQNGINAMDAAGKIPF